MYNKEQLTELSNHFKDQPLPFEVFLVLLWASQEEEDRAVIAGTALPTDEFYSRLWHFLLVFCQDEKHIAHVVGLLDLNARKFQSWREGPKKKAGRR